MRDVFDRVMPTIFSAFVVLLLYSFVYIFAHAAANEVECGAVVVEELE